MDPAPPVANGPGWEGGHWRDEEDGLVIAVSVAGSGSEGPRWGRELASALLVVALTARMGEVRPGDLNGRWWIDRGYPSKSCCSSHHQTCLSRTMANYKYGSFLKHLVETSDGVLCTLWMSFACGVGDPSNTRSPSVRPSLEDYVIYQL